MSTRETMLGLAREAILGRARADGYQDGEYDPSKDDEGYVISLLVALRHWSREHGLDWQAEIERAHQIFQDDLAEEGLQA